MTHLGAHPPWRRRASGADRAHPWLLQLTTIRAMAVPVLFIPGFMQPATAWAAVAERLDPPTALLSHREHSFEGRLA